MELRKSGSSFSVGYRQWSRNKMSRRDPQAMQLPRPFSKAMQHVFLEKARQTQKRYMWRNLQLVRGMTDFFAHNGNKIKPLNDDKLLDILEYRVPASWHREFAVQGFDQLVQGLRKFVELCTQLESCKPSTDKPNVKKSPRSRSAGKRNADTPTKPAGEKKFYCHMHMHNKTHNTKDCFELKQRAKHTKTDKMQKDIEKVTYKDLNAFVNAKVTAAFNKTEKNLKKQKKEKEVKLNAFDKCRSLNVENSNKEDKPNKCAPTNVDNGDGSASCLLSDNSDSDCK
eukprot:4742961-Ditylum_brightwellii.AAC.1